MIESFKDEYRWLSNFWRFDNPLTSKGKIFLTNEHFYVAMKTTQEDLRVAVSQHPLKGLKKFGNTLPLRPDWDFIKLDVMEYGLRYKFSENNPNLRSKLIETGDTYIQEGNYWNDKYWGVCLKTGEGGNNLGKLLMKIRGEILDEINSSRG